MQSEMFDELGAPELIQRCMLVDDRLIYDYMGSSEFEFGSPQAAMKALFSQGMARSQETVNFADQKVTLHLIYRQGFNMSQYHRHYLEKLANNQLRLKEPSYLDLRIKSRLGIPDRFLNVGRDINVWFDINNAVLICLDATEADQLVEVLERIRTKWASK